jgi:hypothetical protein
MRARYELIVNGTDIGAEVFGYIALDLPAGNVQAISEECTT